MSGNYREAECLPVNYHTHSRWCDGQGEIEAVVRAALAAGLRQVGISSHAPVPFVTTYALPLEQLPAYRLEVLRLREAYQDRIEVVLGLELDALDTLRTFNATQVLPVGLDYAIGSVHYLSVTDAGRPWPLDETEALFAGLLAARYGNAIEALVADYYRQVAALATYPGVAIAGHFDRGVVLWNRSERYFSETAGWYRTAVDGALRAFAASGTIVELSTGGWRRDLGAPFPSPWIVRRCHELGVRVTPSTDAHQPEQIAYAYDEALALLRETGHREIAVFDRATGAWLMQALD